SHDEYEVFVFFCFFFQAEDGIRDFHVTGVQTCALPIFVSLENLPRSTVLELVTSDHWLRRTLERRPDIQKGTWKLLQTYTEISRSEERRVGKECRSRWSRKHEKNKDEKIRLHSSSLTRR